MLALATEAYASSRPGGGGSFSGGNGGGSSSGSGSSSGGSSSGGSDALGLLLLVCFEHPAVGVPILIVVVIVFVVRARSGAALRGSEWSTTSPGDGTTPSLASAPLARAPLRGRLDALRRTDPAFSIVVFEDFVYFLYAELHRARGAGNVQALAAYVAEPTLALLGNDGRLAEVAGIIVGGVSYESVEVDAQGGAVVELVFESNYVERYRSQGEQRFYAKERIRLTRAPGARSREPGRARTLDCPSCGAPLSNMRGTTCMYCRTTVPQGTKDWAIASLQVLERDPRGPLLTSDVAEQGNSLPTVLDPGLRSAFAQIEAKDGDGSTWSRLQQRVGLVFQEFHAGWVARDPRRVRPFVSDNLFQSQLYWIDLYRAAQCINRTDGAHIAGLELASATTDAYYDSVTVRIRASGLDYTISETGKLLSGSPTRPRNYSEYWTLMRGAQRRTTDKAPGQCPNCGGPLRVSMTGNCEHCAAKVTSGEYDWVLSRIEQDETYRG